MAGIAADSIQEHESASGAGETKAKVSEGTPQSPAPVVAETSVAQVAVYSAPCEDVAVADIVAEEEAPVAAKALTRSMPRHILQPVIGEEAYREYLKKELIHPQDSLAKEMCIRDRYDIILFFLYRYLRTESGCFIKYTGQFLGNHSLFFIFRCV